jgi:gluconate 5-dehydrogenase
VNAISPTFVRTPQAASLLADEEFYAKLVGRIPLRRIADADDLVGALLFFCSDASSFVTGQILTLDGGLTATQ